MIFLQSFIPSGRKILECRAVDGTSQGVINQGKCACMMEEMLHCDMFHIFNLSTVWIYRVSLFKILIKITEKQSGFLEISYIYIPY
jgi:hypothetical protein